MKPKINYCFGATVHVNLAMCEHGTKASQPAVKRQTIIILRLRI